MLQNLVFIEGFTVPFFVDAIRFLEMYYYFCLL